MVGRPRRAFPLPDRSNSGAYTRILRELLKRHQPFAETYGVRGGRDARQQQLHALMNDFWAHLAAWVVAGHDVTVPGLGHFTIKQHQFYGPTIAFRPAHQGRLRLDKQLRVGSPP